MPTTGSGSPRPWLLPTTPQSSTGRSSSYDDGYDSGEYGNYTESPDTGDGGTDYDPNLYESQPQPEPDVQVPPAQEELAPPQGGGTGAPVG